MTTTLDVLVKAVSNLLALLALISITAWLLERLTKPAISKWILIVGIGQVLGTEFSPSADVAVNLWKFGLGQGITVLALAAISLQKEGTRRRMTLLIGGLALLGLDLILDSRGLALFTILSVTPFVLESIPSKRYGGRQVIGASLAALGVYSLYAWAVSAGRLGESARIKFGWQTGDFGLLMGGRKDFIFLLFGIKNQPIWGYGPAASKDPDAVNDAYTFLTQHHYTITPSDYAALIRPDRWFLHSAALTFFIWVGILALPAVLIAWHLLKQSITAAIFYWQSPVVLFVVATSTWGFFFSPLGDVTRLPLALALAIGLHEVKRTGPGHMKSGRANALNQDRITRTRLGQESPSQDRFVNRTTAKFMRRSI